MNWLIHFLNRFFPLDVSRPHLDWVYTLDEIKSMEDFGIARFSGLARNHYFEVVCGQNELEKIRNVFGSDCRWLYRGLSENHEHEFHRVKFYR